MSAPTLEIQQLLATHSGPMDFSALFILLNTVAGGRYQDLHAEDDIRAALRQLLDQGRIEAWSGADALPPDRVVPGLTVCCFRLAGAR